MGIPTGMVSRPRLNAAIASLVALSLVAAACSHFERKKQIAKVFDAFDLMAAAVTAGAGLLEYKHRLVGATAAFTRMSELDPAFQVSPVGKELKDALDYFQEGSDWRTIQQVRSKALLIKLGEVEIHAPSANDRDLYRWARSSPGSGAAWIEPWARGFDVTEACLKRAMGHLENARILGGRKKGKLYSDPPPRRVEDWIKLLPPEHPERPSVPVSHGPKPRRVVSTGSPSETAAPSVPLRLRIEVTGQASWINAYGDGVLIFDEQIIKGESRTVEAQAEIRLSVTNAAALKLTFNGKVQPPVGGEDGRKTLVFTARGGMSTGQFPP